MKLSVVMPAYNASNFLADAIQSVLNQSFIDFELILIDDCSTDDTYDIIKKFSEKDKRIVVVHNEQNLNIAKSRNKGVALAKGEYVASMDADDICEIDRFRNQVGYLDNNKDISIVIGNLRVMNENGDAQYEREYPLTDQDLKSKIFRYNPFPNPTTMSRKEVYIQTGEYDHQYVPVDDLDFWLRAGCKFKIANVGKVVLNYRVYDKSSSHSKLRKVEILTLKLRWKAIMLGYKPGLMDIFFNIAQLATMILPYKYKVGLFNYLRKHKVL